MTEIDPWLRLHYESGQIPLNDIRQAFRQSGFELGTGTYPEDGLAWATIRDRLLAWDPSAAQEQSWEAFREAALRCGYRPARVEREAQGSTSVGELRPRVEARERIVGQTLGTLRWRSVNGGTATPPVYQGDVGVDLAVTHHMLVEPGGVTYAPLGVHFAAPPGAWILLLGRSSLASKLGLGMVPGVIDNGFRGEMLAGLFTLGPSPVPVPRGTRVAQAILVPMFPTHLVQVDDLPPSDRGENGFGSTGGH